MRTKLATAARWAAQRPRRDQQGIALQTVIVIVVMLVIAGGVATVLLSRGSDVIGDLEGQDVNALEVSSQQECIDAARALTGVSGLSIQSNSATQAGITWSSPTCTVESATDGDPGPISRFVCEQYRKPDGTRATFSETSGGETTCTI